MLHRCIDVIIMLPYISFQFSLTLCALCILSIYFFPECPYTTGRGYTSASAVLPYDFFLEVSEGYAIVDRQ